MKSTTVGMKIRFTIIYITIEKKRCCYFHFIVTLMYIYIYLFGRHFYLLKVCIVLVHGLGVACVMHIYAKNH